MACLLTLARFCAQKSELEVAERWYADSALEDLLGIPWQRVNDARLYRGLAVLHAHKEGLCAHLMERYRSWFGVRFEFLLYDVTSTFFEGQAMRNKKAARGYSRDKRPDCKQVCIGLVVTPEGLQLAYEVFVSNRADVTTVEEIVEAMEKKYGLAERIWILDRGMVSEENIEFLRAKGARYIVGTPKSQLRQFEKELLDSEHWSEVVPGVEVKMVAHPDGAGIEQFVLCRSKSRRTNCPQSDPCAFWQWYIQLQQAEPHFALARAICGYGRSFIRKPRGSKPTSWSAFWHWRCGQPWRCGCEANAWALAPANFQRSRHRAQHGRDPAGQRPRRSPPARRRQTRPPRGRAPPPAGSDPAARAENRRKCSGENHPLIDLRPCKSDQTLLKLTNLG